MCFNYRNHFSDFKSDYADYQSLLADPRHGGDGGQDVGGGGGRDTAHVSLVNDDRAHKVKYGLSVIS